ncbi:MAG: universal stress protein [Nitrospirota bacterium]
MDTIFDKILCATDLSWGCSDIFRDLSQVQESGAVQQMRMLYVVPEGEHRQGAREDALGEFARIKGDLEILGITTETVVREGVVAREIVKEASEWGATIIILSRVDRGVIEDIVQAGTSMDVVKEAAIPVLVEKHSDDTRGHVLKTPLYPLKKVLVPVDVNEAPQGVLEFLTSLAGFVREVVLAHVVEAGTDNEVQRDFELAAEATLADYAQEFEKQGFSTSVHVHRGEPAAGIVEIAMEEKAGLVIMPSSSRTTGREEIGRVASEMVKHSPAPVIFLPRSYQSALRAA